MSLEQDAERGRQANALLSSPIYRDCIERVRSAIIESWQASPIRDKEGQHELKLMLKLLGDLQYNILEVANTGKLAQIEIERDKGLAAKIRGMIG